MPHVARADDAYIFYILDFHFFLLMFLTDWLMFFTTKKTVAARRSCTAIVRCINYFEGVILSSNIFNLH